MSPVTERHVSEIHVLTHHDALKRPVAICVSCGEYLIHGEDIVGMPQSPGSPRWLNRQWHLGCFLRRFPTLSPRESQFTAITSFLRDGR